MAGRRAPSVTPPVGLLDERAAPPVRAALGTLLVRARSADFALARLRLAGIDLTARELAGVARCRVLLGRLDAETFGEAAEMAARDAAIGTRLGVLRAFLESGRVAVRVARAESWSPDFAVLSGVSGPDSAVAIVGAYHLTESYPTPGPRFTCFLRDRKAAARVRARFDESWDRAYGVEDVLTVALVRLVGDGR
jgi:hypothetical protein